MEESFLEPNEVLRKIGFKGDEICADFGSGSGGWTIPLAKMVKEGKVFAIEILPEPISALKAKVKDERLDNVEIFEADIESKVPLEQESCDFVLISNLLFQVENKAKVISEAKRILRKGGKILIVDWKEESSLGPKEKVKISEIKNLAKNLLLKIEDEFEAGKFHFGLLLKKE